MINLNFKLLQLTFAGIFLAINVSIGQKINKDTINGAELNVYPFRTETNFHSSYYSAFKKTRGKQNRIALNEYLSTLYEEDMSKADFRKYKRMLKGDRYSRSYDRESRHLSSRKFKKAVRTNPYPLLESKYTNEKDIVPFLGALPDGKYVQYFDTFGLLLPNGKSQLMTTYASGYFTMKNNLLEGEAIWLNVKGDTLKIGTFIKGQKVGEWTIESRRPEYSISKKSADHYVDFGFPLVDTVREISFYENGIQNGKYYYYENSKFPVVEGTYKDNIAVGEWLEREVSYTGIGKKRKRNRNNDVITFRYTPDNSKQVVKRPMIRYNLIGEYDYMSEFDFDSKYEPNIQFHKLYAIAYPTEEDIELDEEKIESYEGGEEGDYYEGEDEYYEEEEYYNETYVRTKYNYETGESVSYAKLIDSIGMIFNYSGVYEKRYPNGKLMVRFEFKDGKLLEEDTIFWDNGKVYDVINFDVDSNQYTRRVFDYSGTLYKEIVFDSIGDFVRVNFEPETIKYVNIDGFIAEDRLYGGKYFFYDKMDTLDHAINDSIVLFRSWFKGDTSLLYNRTYYPSDKKLTFDLYSVMGTPSLEAEINFGEDFNSWTGSKNFYAGDLRLETKSSASFSEFYTKDSIPQRHVNAFSEYFEVTDDHTLYSKGQVFNGPVEMTFGNKKFTMQTGKKLLVNFGNNPRKFYKLDKQVMKYRQTGKIKNELLFKIIDASETEEQYASGIYSNLFGGSLNQLVEFPYDEYGEYGDYEGDGGGFYPSASKVVGQYMNGKPSGLWKVYDQKGKVITDVNYVNGELEGTMNSYAYAYPRNKEYYGYEEDLGDSLPKKRTYYLTSKYEFKNGMMNGAAVNYNWLGETTMSENYRDGMKEGKAFERNKLAHTNLNYENGSLDGYVRTYLTLPKKDSMILFDLNFQNGLLQGESKSYHTNGKIAKKGFFLNGDPIDDYEAYDTLGFKYHYVKFMYSYPVEEKIWEENQLSVRYLFDWRDSIEFSPSDITSTQSLDRVLYKLGIGRENMYEPYYGRPSIVEKTGIDYHMTKYYPNDSIARDGSLSVGKKVGCWKFYSYEGEFLYEADYFDTVIVINDSVKFKAKGILTDYNAAGDKLSESYIIEKFEKYDCSHTDHYEIRQLMTIWQVHDSLNRFNGYVKNYYDNGVLQNEGNMKDGLPTGVWKYYDPYGKLNQVGEFVLGKRNGRWLGGDLSKTKYLGDICLNPNMPNIEEVIKYREKLLDIVITNYKMGKALNKEFYDVNMNNYEVEGEGESVQEEEIIEETEE
jgi:antitoxin component YwqK of YwqJK toxin-antitoxin module